MADLKSPGEVGGDIRKFMDSIPGPADLVRKLGLPTPFDIEQHQHEERKVVFEKTAMKGDMTPDQFIRAVLPPGPVDFGNIALLRV